MTGVFKSTSRAVANLVAERWNLSLFQTLYGLIASNYGSDTFTGGPSYWRSVMNLVRDFCESHHLGISRSLEGLGDNEDPEELLSNEESWRRLCLVFIVVLYLVLSLC